MSKTEFERIRRLLTETIKLFDLDLRGMTVLTEAASGNYYVTPLIAALAGAKVYAIARDSEFGEKEEVGRYVAAQAELFSVNDTIEIMYQLSDRIINKSDIVTNLGLLRPIDSPFIRAMHDRAVITSMCENWEVREKDIDRVECRKKGILLGAVNEESEIRDIFRYVGYLAFKLVLETGLEILNNRFFIIGSDKFGRTITSVLKLNGAEADLIDTETLNRETLSRLRDPEKYHAIIIADYTCKESIIAQSGKITAEEISEFFPAARIIHLAGEVDTDYLLQNGITCHPTRQGFTRRMTVTLDYLGMQPLIELHTAGLKVGEMLCRERKLGLQPEKIRRKFTNHSLCQLLD
jgi:hypothetical protein